MGLFNIFLGGSGRHGSSMPEQYRNALRQMRKLRSKAYRTLRMIIIFAVALNLTLFILTFLVASMRNPILYEFIFIVFALCFGGALCLPWITQLERDKRRRQKGEKVSKGRNVMAYLFFVFIGVCVAFWIISVFTVGSDIFNAMWNKDEVRFSTFTPLRAAIILSLQALYFTVILTTSLRYGKNYMGLRVVMYIALGYLDIWISWIVAIVTLDRIDAHALPPITFTPLWVIAVLMAVMLAVAGGIFGAQARRKEIELFMKGDIKNLAEGDVDLIDAETTSSVYTDTPSPAPAPAPAPAPQKSVEEQLAKIAELRDKGIITEEEYQAKRKDIIDKL